MMRVDAARARLRIQTILLIGEVSKLDNMLLKKLFELEELLTR